MKNIRVGIITLPLNTNYGGILQAYAFQLYLQKLGYYAILLDRRHNIPMKEIVKQNLKKILYPNFEKIKRDYESNFSYFIDKQIANKSPRLYSKKSLEDFITKNELTHILTGSDQVWRCDYSNIVDELFLNLNVKIRKASYAASFGFESWKFPKYTDKIKMYLRSFDSISVREDSGIEICKGHFGVSAEAHLDPTMLLDFEDYDKLIEQEKELSNASGKLLAYILDDSVKKEEFIDELARHNNFEKHTLKGNEIDVGNYKRFKATKKKGITSWLKAFKECDYVVTDSFHGTLFALYYNKNFIVLGNKDRGLGRFTSILSKFDLLDRMVLETNEANYELITEEIEFDKVNEVFDKERILSKQYLLNFLNKW